MKVRIKYVLPERSKLSRFLFPNPYILVRSVSFCIVESVIELSRRQSFLKLQIKKSVNKIKFIDFVHINYIFIFNN